MAEETPEIEVEETPVEAYVDELNDSGRLPDEPLPEEKEEPEDLPEPEVEEPEDPPKPGDIKYTKKVKARIDEITREKGDALRDVEYWKNKALGKPDAKEEQAPAQQQVPTPTKPKEEDFDTNSDFIEALGSWRYQKDKSEDAAKTSADQVKVDSDQMLNKFNERVEASGIRDKNPDFDNLVESPIFTPTMTELVLGSEVGPEMALFLAQNTEKAQAIANMSPLGAAKEIGKLEVQLNQKPNKKRDTNAPNVIKTLNGNDVPRVNLNTCSQSDYERVRMKQMAAANGR